MTGKQRSDLMRPISVSVSPTLIDQLQERARQMAPDNPNVSGYLRKLIMQDLERTVMDRSRSLWIHKELERVESLLGTLKLFESIPKPLLKQAAECLKTVEGVRQTLWQLAGAESRPPAGALSSSTPSAGAEALREVDAADFDQLAQSVPARAVAGPTARKRKPSAGTSLRSKARKSSPKRARG